MTDKKWFIIIFNICIITTNIIIYDLVLFFLKNSTDCWRLFFDRFLLEFKFFRIAVPWIIKEKGGGVNRVIFFELITKESIRIHKKIIKSNQYEVNYQKEQNRNFEGYEWYIFGYNTNMRVIRNARAQQMFLFRQWHHSRR